MPIPTGGVVKIDLLQTYFAQRVINTFYYWDQSNTEPSSFVGFIAAWDTLFMSDLAALQAVGVVYDSIKASTVFGTLPDLEVTPTQLDGNVIGLEMASWLAFKYRLFGTTKETRSGFKRFAGLVEINVDGNDVTTAFKAAMNALEPILAASVVVAATYVPIILRRPNGTTILDFFANPVASAQGQLDFTSQDTRKPKT